MPSYLVPGWYQVAPNGRQAICAEIRQGGGQPRKRNWDSGVETRDDWNRAGLPGPRFILAVHQGAHKIGCVCGILGAYLDEESSRSHRQTDRQAGSNSDLLCSAHQVSSHQYYTITTFIRFTRYSYDSLVRFTRNSLHCIAASESTVPGEDTSTTEPSPDAAPCLGSWQELSPL